jgi:fructose-1,6-bisphosphatase/inositol monophosphatase family enzyme
MHSLTTSVAALLRKTATDIVLPRYRALQTHEIQEKSPGDFVTIADKESELALNEGLARILPEARLIGEEACAAAPHLLDGLESGTAWIIDPIDGTGNFAAGRPHFALMIALVADGEPIAGWIYDPLRDRLCHAHHRGGAWINGERIFATPSGAPLPIAALSTRFMDPDQRADMTTRAHGRLTLADVPLCAGEQYPRIALGENDLSVYERTLPWDHIAGAQFLTEAGGHIARMDGTPYRFWDGRTGLLGAVSHAIWDDAVRILTMTV